MSWNLINQVLSLLKIQNYITDKTLLKTARLEHIYMTGAGGWIEIMALGARITFCEIKIPYGIFVIWEGKDSLKEDSGPRVLPPPFMHLI